MVAREAACLQGSWCRRAPGISPRFRSPAPALLTDTLARVRPVFGAWLFGSHTGFQSQPLWLSPTNSPIAASSQMQKPGQSHFLMTKLDFC